jgi:hypothetical protein
MSPNQREPTFSFPPDIVDGEARLRELILYIAARCERDPRFGATKLNKILLFADFLAYFRRRRPITGVEYMRLPNGPAPRRLKRRNSYPHSAGRKVSTKARRPASRTRP